MKDFYTRKIFLYGDKLCSLSELQQMNISIKATLSYNPVGCIDYLDAHLIVRMLSIGYDFNNLFKQSVGNIDNYIYLICESNGINLSKEVIKTRLYRLVALNSLTTLHTVLSNEQLENQGRIYSTFGMKFFE